MSAAERLLLDEMFAPMLAEQLRAEGFDMVAVTGHPTLAAASDEQGMRWATAQGHRLVTENVKDFEPLTQLVHEGGEPIPLRLFTNSRRFPRSRRNPGPFARCAGSLAQAAGRPHRPNRLAELIRSHRTPPN